MYKGVVNSPETFLKENLVQGATIMYVADGSVFGALPTLAVIGDDESAETVLVESFDNGAYTIRRAFEGTAKDWTKGTTVARNFTNYDYQAVVDNIDELSKRKIPTKLSELTDDSTHRLVTDAQRKAWDGKVDKVTGKGLSTNDYTDKDKAQIAESKAKIDGFNQYAQEINAKADQALTNNAELDNKKADRTEIKTKLSEMVDDSTHRTVTDEEKKRWNENNSMVEELSIIGLNLDNEIYKAVDYRKIDGELAYKSELIGEPPKYSKIKLSEYQDQQIKSTKTWNLFYDSNDFIYKKELERS